MRPTHSDHVLTIGRQVPRRAALVATGTLAALLLVVVASGFGRSEMSSALGTLPHANLLGLAAAAVLFVLASLCSAAAWRTAIQASGGAISCREAAACYGCGCLANSLLPGGVGEVVRVTLVSRRLRREGSLWTAAGISLAMIPPRSLVLLGLVLAATAHGSLPLLPVLLLGAIVLLALVVAVAVQRWRPRRVPLARLLDASRALGRSPRAAIKLTAWEAGAVGARVGAAAAIAAALGVRSPVAAALVIVPALELAGLLPLTPASLGIASGAVTLALHAGGVPVAEALAIGIALHAMQTLGGIMLGGWSALHLAAARSAAARRLSMLLASAGALGAAAVAGALIAT